MKNKYRIPKTIHYCWFGGKDKPEDFKKIYNSWEKIFPNYNIVEWNENNYDVNKYSYTQEAYQAKKYAFVSDVARLDVIYKYGGIYLDVDVEVIKKYDDLIDCNSFFGLQQEGQVGTGLGFGSIPNNPLIKKILDDYKGKHFKNNDGTFDTTPCTIVNSKIFLDEGYRLDDTIEQINKNYVYPAEFFNPINEKGQIIKTENTHSIHHYASSWYTKSQKKRQEIKKKVVKLFGYKIGLLIYRTILAPYVIYLKIKDKK